MVPRVAEAVPAGTTSVLGCSPPGSVLCLWPGMSPVHPLLGGWSLSHHSPMWMPTHRDENIFPNTAADKNHMRFESFFPSCFSTRLFPPAEWVLFMCCPGFPFPPALALSLPMPPVLPWLVPVGLYEPPQPQAPCRPLNPGLQHTSPGQHPNWHPPATRWQCSLGLKCSPAAEITA